MALNTKTVGDLRLTTRAEMLAVVLYTGCDCNYAMCAAERGGDYKTWSGSHGCYAKPLRSSPYECTDTVYSGECRRSKAFR